VYLSTSRLPTEKAYGVTVMETSKSARSLGIEFTVCAPGLNSDHLRERITTIPAIKFPTFLRNHEVPGLRMAFFRLNSILIPVVATGMKKFHKCEFIWLRDPISALVLANIVRRKKILLEIHHRPVGLSLSLTKKLSKKNNLTFAALTSKLLEQIQNDVPGINILEAPMGVPESFFKRRDMVHEKSRIRLLYIGKGESSGFDNGLEVLVGDFGRALHLHPHISMTFLGLERRYQVLITERMVELGIGKERVMFLDHLPHFKVPSILDSHDVGVLPYLESTYNNERFPIKSLEYAAAELSILASETEGHVSLIGPKNAFFYKPGEVNSFESQVTELVKNLALRAEKVANAKIWAENFTYRKRIQRVVNQWLGESL
jgi:glycosyltransferase involved in cell wall biosynthesis